MSTIRLPSVAILVVIFLQIGCKHSTEPPGQTDTTSINPAPDTNWITRPQLDIPWPGLANSPWPMFLHDPQHTGRSPYRGPQEGKMEWMFDAGKMVYSSPAIDEDGTVYFGCDNYYIFALAPSGSQKWNQLGGGGDSSPLIGSEGTVYFYGPTGTLTLPQLYAVNRNGNVIWQMEISIMAALSAPSISKDGQTVYLAAGNLYAVSKNGMLQWKMNPDPTDAVRYSLAISPEGKTLYVPGYKALYAVDTSGGLKWSFGQRTSNPAVDNEGNIYFGAGYQDRVYSLNPDGTVRWVANKVYWGPEDPGPVIGRDGTIYITGDGLYAIDYAGKLRWKYVMPGQSWSQCVPAIDVDGTLYFGKITARTASDSLNFYAVNPNGTLKFAISLRCPDASVPDIDSRPAISSDGKIYVGSDYPRGFYLYKIR